MDYATLHKLSYSLGRLFWRDLEIHHPGIDALRLPADVATGWKEQTWAEDPDTGKRRDLNLEEHQAFWTLAAVNVLRHTGIRIEELGELSHHSLIHYKLPATGSDKVAVVIIAETGADMTRFPTAAHLASWAGVCPSQNESAGRTKSTSPRPGNSYIKAALGNAAMGAARTNGCYLQARYRRLAARSSALKALVAIEHSILVSVWNMITNNQSYHDLGGDYYARRDPAAAMRRIVRQANALGMNVRFDPIEQPI